MSDHVLVPLDTSPLSQQALDYALAAFADEGTEFTVLHVLDYVEAGYDADLDFAGPGYLRDWHENAQQRAERLFEEAHATADEYAVTLRTETEHGRPARTIVEFAGDHGVDHIVMGSHGRSGVSRLLLGSVAELVLRRAPCPVTVVR